MRLSTIITVVAGLTGAIVLSQALTSPPEAHAAASATPTTTYQCIEVDGRNIPAVCKVPGSRLGNREDICTCPNGGMRTEVAVCAKDQKPPAEGNALNIARSSASRDGSLVGDTVAGQPICLAPRNRG